MKKLIKMLRILPVVNLLKRQKSVIEALRKQLEFTETWVAVADFNHGLAEEKAEHAKEMYEACEQHIARYKEIVKMYDEQIANYKSMNDHNEKMIDNRNRMVELLQARLDLHGL